jgi:hypothetical protein
MLKTEKPYSFREIWRTGGLAKGSQFMRPWGLYEASTLIARKRKRYLPVHGEFHAEDCP